MAKVKKAVKKASKKSSSKSSFTNHSANKTGIIPLADRVVIKPLSPDDMGSTTSFGIIIPDTAKEKPEQGTVVAVGAGKKTDDGKVIPVSVKVGDRVMFSKYGFDEIKVAGVEYYIVSEQNILAILN
jgi:chaperonin GroES